MLTAQPLVSIMLITYNSSQYVEETLESCLVQTYKNIELIITDDASQDNTLSICEQWLEANHERFVRTQLIKVQENTGISANCNRGVKASQGKWIKLIAGDDILLENCVEDYVAYIQEHPNTALCVSNMIVFNDSGNNKEVSDKYNQITKKFTSKTAASQVKSYLRFPAMLNIPSEFIRAEVIKDLGGFDEEFRLLEDTPFLSKLLLKGYKVDFMNVFTVKYRRHENNITTLSQIAFETNLYKCYLKYARPHLKVYNILDVLFLLYRDLYYNLKLNNKSSVLATNFYKISYVLGRIA